MPVQETKVKPTFKGSPLVDPTLVPSIGFLTDDFGEAVFAAYQEEVVKYHPKARESLDVLAYNRENKVITGSNSFAAVVLNNLPIIRDSGLHIATQADLGLMLKGDDTLRVADNHYIDTGLVLRSEDDPNSYLARILAADIKERTKQDSQYPLLIHLKDVRVEPDEKSPYGLVFKLESDAKPVHALILNKTGYYGNQDIDAETGLPKETAAKKTEEHNRQLYTTQRGLVRLGLDRDLVLGAYVGRLADSDSDGRVAVVGAPKK